MDNMTISDFVNHAKQGSIIAGIYIINISRAYTKNGKTTFVSPFATTEHVTYDKDTNTITLKNDNKPLEQSLLALINDDPSSIDVEALMTGLSIYDMIECLNNCSKAFRNTLIEAIITYVDQHPKVAPLTESFLMREDMLEYVKSLSTTSLKRHHTTLGTAYVKIGKADILPKPLRLLTMRGE